MYSRFNYIRYRTINYSLNSESGYYEKIPNIVTFNKLPNDLKVEETQAQKIREQGANEIIRGRIKNGKYSFLTGLISLNNSPTVYFGNNYEFVENKKRTSLIVFVFSNGNRELTVYYFNHFYKSNRADRIIFVQEFINSLG